MASREMQELITELQREILRHKERICRQMAGIFPFERLRIISRQNGLRPTEEELVFAYSPGVDIGLAYFFWKNGKVADGITIKVCPFGMQVAREKMHKEMRASQPKKEK